MKTMFLFRRSHAPQQILTGSHLRRQLPLRKPGGGYPIAVVTTLAAGALAGMMLAPASGSAFSPVGSPANAIEAAHTTPKTSRLPRASAILSARSIQDSMKAPSACTLSPAAPSRSGPVAYV